MMWQIILGSIVSGVALFVFGLVCGVLVRRAALVKLIKDQQVLEKTNKALLQELHKHDPYYGHEEEF